MDYGGTTFHYNLDNPKWVTLENTLLIPKSASTIWSVMSSIGHLEKVHPFCKKHTSNQWMQISDKDIFEFYNGKKFYRTVIEWVEGQSFTLDLKDETDFIQKVRFQILPLKPNVSSMFILFETDAFKRMALKNWEEYCKNTLIPDHRHYFSSVLRGFEHFVTTGNKVKRNLFGPHREYSPRLA